MMDGFSPARKDTVLIPSGPTDHLHFVCCDLVFYPKQAKECVLLVNISTIKQDIDYDLTCIVEVGDHPFVTRPSYIYYRKADIFGADSLSRNVAEGAFQVHQPCSDELFTRILNGFDISEDVRLKVKKFYSNYCR